MKTNTLVFSENESISFGILFDEDDESDTLPDGYSYYFRVKSDLDGDRLIDVTSSTNTFDIENTLCPGSYYFEIGMTNGLSSLVICSPVDSSGRRINELIVTRGL